MSTHLPVVHSVHIYNESSALISRLCGIVAASLKIGDSVVIVATADHRGELIKQLQNSGMEVRSHARDGRYTMFDAHEMLASFMRNGLPDRDRFIVSMGKILAEGRKAARSRTQGLTVFGEMVSVLWDEGKKEAAFQLEQLWNDALNDRAFHLHCAYPRGGFINQADEECICKAHTHVVMQ